MEPMWWTLLLFPVCSGHSEYQGTVMTYHPLQTHPDGSVTVDVRYKSNSQTCVVNDYLLPSDGFHTVSQTVTTINDSPGGFCQNEEILILRAPSNTPILMRAGPNQWSSTVTNGVSTAQASSLIELRTRSDTGQTNASPQTTVLPVFRIPHNCQRDFSLPTFDPDGDLVRCRFANDSIDPTECLQCSPPPMLSLTPPCTLSFSATHSSARGLYAVQLMMEDFPRTDIHLSLSGTGEPEQRRTTDAISKVALQFLLSVDESVDSCNQGQFLPGFEDETPENGAQISATAGQAVQIRIEARLTYGFWSFQTDDQLLQLVFSGPSGITLADSESTRTGNFGYLYRFILRWTPVETEIGQRHPVCFSAQTSSSERSSELRCVIVTVIAPPTEAPPVPVTRKVRIQTRMSTSAELSDDAVQEALIKQIDLELKKRGLSQDVAVHLSRKTLAKVTAS